MGCSVLRGIPPRMLVSCLVVLAWGTVISPLSPALATTYTGPSDSVLSEPPSSSPSLPAMLKGTTVVLDPGHNGANASHPVEVNRPVPNGRGGTKACDTTGTSTDGGYSEHAFNWDVARRVHDALTAHGVCVVLTRPDDAEVGPCVNDRAAIANRAAATAIISIHADGAAPSGHGFHVSYSDPPLNDSQGQPSVALAQTLAKARYRQRLWSDVRRRAGQLRLKLAVSVGTTLGSLPRSHHRDAPGRKADRLVSR